MMSKITDELKKYKNAATSEAKETRLLVKILMSAAKEYKKDKKFKLDDEDIQFIKDQSQDLLKLIPLISNLFNKCLEKCNPAVGAATAPSSFA